MMLSYAKPFNKKMREQLVKIWKKNKHARDFCSLLVDDMKKKRKNANLLCSYKNTQQKTTIFTEQA